MLSHTIKRYDQIKTKKPQIFENQCDVWCEMDTSHLTPKYLEIQHPCMEVKQLCRG